MILRDDEKRFLQKSQERCPACGHLELFHLWDTEDPDCCIVEIEDAAGHWRSCRCSDHKMSPSRTHRLGEIS